MLLLGVLVLVVVFFRLVLQGRLPDRIGRDAAEWFPEEAAESREGLQKLRALVDEHTKITDDLLDRTERSLAELQEEVMAIRRDDRILRDDREDAGDA